MIFYIIDFVCDFGLFGNKSILLNILFIKENFDQEDSININRCLNMVVSITEYKF